METEGKKKNKIKEVIKREYPGSELAGATMGTSHTSLAEGSLSWPSTMGEEERGGERIGSSTCRPSPNWPDTTQIWNTAVPNLEIFSL